MRPAPLMLALLLAWAALGGLVLGGLLPRWSWACAAKPRYACGPSNR